MVARQIYVNPPKITEYEIAFNFDSIKAFFWYILWTFNVPEEFKKQIAKNLIIFEGIFLRDYWLLVFKSFVGVTAFVLLAAVLPFYKLVRNHRFNSQTAKLVVFGLVWFLTAISPVLLLPNHNFIMYLTLPSIGIFTAIACLLVLSKDKSLIILSVLIWIFLSATTLNFYRTNSYTQESQKTSKKFAQEITTRLPFLPANSVVFYPLSYRQETQSLLEQNAIQALYGDTSLSIYYNKEDLLSSLQFLQGRLVYMVAPQ